MMYKFINCNISKKLKKKNYLHNFVNLLTQQTFQKYLLRTYFVKDTMIRHWSYGGTT